MNPCKYKNKDKRKLVLALITHPQSHCWSNREIARQCGVSLDLVNRLRKGVQPSERIAQIQEFTDVARTPKEQDICSKKNADPSERIAQIQNFENIPNLPSAERLVHRKGKTYRMKIDKIGKGKQPLKGEARNESLGN